MWSSGRAIRAISSRADPAALASNILVLELTIEVLPWVEDPVGELCLVRFWHRLLAACHELPSTIQFLPHLSHVPKKTFGMG